MSNENNNIEETLMVHCPFTDEQIERDDCISRHTAPEPFGGVRKREWWEMCQTCEHNTKLVNSLHKFNDIMERLKNASNATSYNVLADMLGLQSKEFANLKKINSIPYERVLLLANSLNVSADWILTGEGEMSKD